MKEFGWTNPVLIDENNGIIAGHGRVLAAAKLGIAKVPTIKLAHLSETQRRAYVIADNKLALNAGWDEQLLGLELADLREADFDLGVMGFDAEAIEAMLNPPEPDFEPGTEQDQGKLDEKSPIECPHCHKFFTT
jgi:ParB-like chromosome segregation protein Spo0J